MTATIPIIALTGYLGAGKTTVLNHLLTRPGTRVGVIINDFGAINVDQLLVTGQVDEAESIAGGCICCLPDDGNIEQTLAQLARPELRLDAILIEASGVADPLALYRILRTRTIPTARFGGIIDVVDALEHEATVDTGALAPARFAAAGIVVINKLDRIPDDTRAEALAGLSARVHEANPGIQVVPSERGNIDPTLIFDIAGSTDPEDQLPLAALARAEYASPHIHAHSVTVGCTEPVDAAALLTLLEGLPAEVYRLKGCVPVATARGVRHFVINVVGRSIHVAAPSNDLLEEIYEQAELGHPRETNPDGDGADGGPGIVSTGDARVLTGLVAIGLHLDENEVRSLMQSALMPAREQLPRPRGEHQNTALHEPTIDHHAMKQPLTSAQALARLDTFRRLST